MSKSEGQVLDFEKICRLCLLEKRSMSAIFSKKKGDKKVPLPVRIMSCASLELYEGDGLPASICNKCLLSVNQSYAFREQCEQADTTLRQYAQRMNETNEEPSTTRERGERIGNVSHEPIGDVGIRNKGDSGDGRGVGVGGGGGVEETEVVEETKCVNADKQFGLGIVSEESLSSGTKGNSMREVCLGLLTDNRKEGVEMRPDDDERLVDEKLSVLLVDNKMKGVSDYERMDSNESEAIEEEESPVKTCFKGKPENVVVVADVETISTNFLSDMEGEDGGEFKKSADNDSRWNGRENKSPVENNGKEKGKSVSKIHLQLLQKLIKNREILVQKRSPAKILIMKKESGSRFCQMENGSVLQSEMTESLKKLEEVDERLSHCSQSESNNDCRFAQKLVSEGINKPEMIMEGFGDEKGKGGEGGKRKWKNAKDTVFCNDCKIFLLRSSYSNHVKFVHKKVRQYLCQSCGYAACTGTILRQHVQAVHNGYSFYCDQCPKRFNLMKRLRKHMEVEHLGKPVERNHVCQYCGMAFTKPAYLKRHLRSHTQETPYQCRYCHRRFKYNWPKVQHERLHTGEKPYKCTFCDERFTQNCVRKIHEYKVHGNEEFKPKTRAKKVTRIRRKSKCPEDSRESVRSGSE